MRLVRMVIGGMLICGLVLAHLALASYWWVSARQALAPRPPGHPAPGADVLLALVGLHVAASGVILILWSFGIVVVDVFLAPRRLAPVGWLPLRLVGAGVLLIAAGFVTLEIIRDIIRN